MDGLYALKPWYAARLRRPLALLVRHNVAPTAVSWAGVAAAALAGGALAGRAPGAGTGLVVLILLAARLACANLDGNLARAGGRDTRVGSLQNELTDRLADLAVLAGLLPRAGAGWALAAMFASTLPSWVALAGRAAGGPRMQGGPVGKTERCMLVALIALTGDVSILVPALVAGGVVTATFRTIRLQRVLRGVA
jgi:CDP-diacylglycerol--glycerol-3-phosphate 3-phosphatidyltransferase